MDRGPRERTLGFPGEERAGARFLRRNGRVWTTDKDGIVAALRSAEITARTGSDRSERYSDLVRALGEPAERRLEATATLELSGIERTFYHYVARGAPFGPDDGTVAPWVVVSSLPFAPKIVLPATRRNRAIGTAGSRRGTTASTRVRSCSMVENYRTGLLWRLMRGCPYVVSGLKRAGFSGGWL